MRIKEKEKDKSKLISHFGTYRYIRMQVDIHDATAMLQRLLVTILSIIQSKSYFSYIGIVVIFSKTSLQHVNNIKEVLTLLRETEVTL